VKKVTKTVAKKKAAKKVVVKTIAKKKAAAKKAVAKTVAKKKTVKKVVKKVVVKKTAAKKAVAKPIVKNKSVFRKVVKKKAARKPFVKQAPGPLTVRKAGGRKSKAPAVTSAVTAAARAGKIKTPLNRKELKEFRKLLMAKRRSLLGDMSGMEGQTIGRKMQESAGDLSNMPTHLADIGSDNYEQEFTLGLLASERTLLNEIDAALARIDNGIYGVCLGTAEPIPQPRLRARPWCKYGIEYKKRIEKGLAREGEDDLIPN
jgi:DnaK suppressor protein